MLWGAGLRWLRPLDSGVAVNGCSVILNSTFVVCEFNPSAKYDGPISAFSTEGAVGWGIVEVLFVCRPLSNLVYSVGWLLSPLLLSLLYVRLAMHGSGLYSSPLTSMAGWETHGGILIPATPWVFVCPKRL